MTREDVIRLMVEAEPDMLINIKDHEEGMEGFTGEDPKLMQFWPFKTYVKFADLDADMRVGISRIFSSVDDAAAYAEKLVKTPESGKMINGPVFQ